MMLTLSDQDNLQSREHAIVQKLGLGEVSVCGSRGALIWKNDNASSVLRVQFLEDRQVCLDSWKILLKLGHICLRLLLKRRMFRFTDNTQNNGCLSLCVPDTMSKQTRET
ncbi:hypothetical protein AV530_010951 [Patagioenas fasciata monilis]|uniref:Uncharacterized protein n=1 Tax=Patagioenas fasciata monilis TaxID=372326 RepID=A0A1V4K8A6_PATFA|nr:hypothetical protein AV530_010951 [Patagioenas fasciata monilis]